jgi:hypothetical protein
VRVVLSSVVLSGALGIAVPARATEPLVRPIAAPEAASLPAPEPSAVPDIVQGGVAASFVFAAFGLGMGAAAAATDAESERKRDDPCRTCVGGFNEMQREMATLANASMFSFIAAGAVGIGTAFYAALGEDDVKKEKDKPQPLKAAIFVRGTGLGVELRF